MGTSSSESNRTLLGLVDKDETEIEIEPDALEDLYVKRRLFKDRLVLRPIGSELLDVVPGRHAEELELRVSRKLRSRVDHLIDTFWSQV